ncbi:TPA: hypothetical protein U1C27_002075 [Streptococcus suis]|nr:hypothetical protein [Streptococcus suis]HEM3621238.1 hypothetical protein [Streptococcus suis]
MKWYENTVIMTFLGVILGAIIGFAGTIYSSRLKLKEIENQHIYELENRGLDKKEEISIKMIQSIYGLHKMNDGLNDGLIEENLSSFKEESYTILAKARIYCSQNVVDLYNQFLTTFFKNQIYDGKIVDLKLIPAIRKDLGVDK